MGQSSERGDLHYPAGLHSGAQPGQQPDGIASALRFTCAGGERQLDGMRFSLSEGADAAAAAGGRAARIPAPTFRTSRMAQQSAVAAGLRTGLPIGWAEKGSSTAHATQRSQSTPHFQPERLFQGPPTHVGGHWGLSVSSVWASLSECQN